jgi:hypothetical protein
VSVRRTVLAAVVTAVLASPVVAPASGRAAVADGAVRDPGPGTTWHYRAQIDGLNGRDDITITASPGFVFDHGAGDGMVTVTVALDGGSTSVLYVSLVEYYSVRSPWTPWLGAADLDKWPGRELVIGVGSGAHSANFEAFAYRPVGQFVEPGSPLGDDWFVNHSVGTGSSGWRCTRKGVQLRAVSPPRGGHARVRHDRYVFTTSGWQRTSHHTKVVPVDRYGNPPAYTARYGLFSCPGLPKRVL